MIDHDLSRAEALLQQRRAAQAIDYVKKALAFSPDRLDALLLLCRCHIDLGQMEEAEKAVNDLIHRAPDLDIAHYIKSQVAFDRDDMPTAERHIDEAISLDPDDADFRSLRGQYFFHNKEWASALESADRGLALDPANINCLNLRSNALIKLGRAEEAFATMEKTLEEDAENPYSHATTGWNHLENGDHRKALEHFTTALRLDPDNEYAKSGMVEALKAKKWPYRLFLRYSFWIGNMKKGTQWALILGAYFLVRILSSLSESQPALEPYILPLIVVYTLFALSTWVIAPLANLFLRTDPQGRYALDEQEMRVGNFTLVAVAIAGIGLFVWLLSALMGYPSLVMPAQAALMYGFLMLLPLAGLLVATDKNRNALRLMTLALSLLGGFALISVVSGGPLLSAQTMPFLLGMFVYQFVGQYFMSRG